MSLTIDSKTYVITTNTVFEYVSGSDIGLDVTHAPMGKALLATIKVD